MLPLPTEFEDRLFRYAQVSRKGDLAIFTQTHKASGHVRYEVVLIRIQKEHTWPTGVTTPEKEAYPGSTTWGRFGQTCTALAEAQVLAATWRQQREASSLPEEAAEEERRTKARRTPNDSQRAFSEDVSERVLKISVAVCEATYAKMSLADFTGIWGIGLARKGSLHRAEMLISGIFKHALRRASGLPAATEQSCTGCVPQVAQFLAICRSHVLAVMLCHAASCASASGAHR